MRCLACSTENDSGARLCRECGADLSVVCARCDSQNRATARFCEQCGVPLERGEPSRKRVPPAERREITVLFCDLVNSSALSERLDPEDLREVLRAYQVCCGEVVGRFTGHIAQYLGDGLLAYFGYPLAHEDGPRRAVRAGLRLIEAVRDLSPSFGGLGTPLQVRVGIHTGSVVVDTMGQDDRGEQLAVGEAPNIAARIQGIADPGSVVMSEATSRLVDGYFAVEELGAVSLRGFSTPVSLYKVIAESGAHGRLDALAEGHLTPFVGRELEVHALADHWRTTRSGKASLVAICGEPGIGKSRLVRVLHDHVSSATSIVMQAYGSPLFQGTALRPILEMIERWLCLSRAGSREDKLAILRSEMERVDIWNDEGLSLLATALAIPTDGVALPLALSPQKQRQATFELLIKWLHALTKQFGVLFVVEDAHWADPSTMEFLGLAMDREPPGRLMILVTHRPDFNLPWNSSNLHRMTLERMSREDTQRIVRAVLDDRFLPNEIQEQVLAKADGIPLYAEEITKAVLESQVSPAGGRSSKGAPAEALPMPSTVTDSFVARLDRLGGEGKATAQLAATIGRSFTFDVLHAVSGMDEALLRQELDRLVSSELLYRSRSSIGDSYTFKHALIQDAAYGSLLRRTRQTYHRQIANILSERFSALGNTQPELLARHYGGADMASEAITKWIAAGQQAIARSAYLEALSSFRGALEQLAKLSPSGERDRTEVELRTTFGVALISTYGYSAKEVEENYGRAAELCERLGDVPPAVLYYVWGVHLVRSDREATSRLARVFESLANTSTDPEILRVAYAALGCRAFWLGRYDESRRHCAKALQYCDFDDSRLQREAFHATPAFEIYLYMRLYIPWCDVLTGFPERARSGWQGAVDFAERVRSPFAMAMALSYAAWGEHDFGGVSSANEMAVRQVALAAEHGFPFWVSMGTAMLGWAGAKTGLADVAIPQIEGALMLLRNIGGFLVCPLQLTCLAEVNLIAGKLDDALRVANENFTFCEDKLSEHHLPVLYRVRGNIHVARGDRSAGESDYRQSLALAHEQGAKWIELESGTALTRLLRNEGRAAEGRALLASTYSQFTEGFEFPALAEARQLLAELS
jgi:class 3 adenylate cyclase/tetratricopeptide (TPR) repeat protein